MELEFCAPCLFGLEGPLGNELRHMDMITVSPENGRVYFTGGEDAMARANLRSRFAERILLVMGRFSRACGLCPGRTISRRTALSPLRGHRSRARCTPCPTARGS